MCGSQRVGAQAMAAQGSGGAFEISQRMTAAVGWGATAAFTDDWVWDQAAATYALDPDMAATLRKNNPQARLPVCGAQSSESGATSGCGIGGQLLEGWCLITDCACAACVQRDALITTCTPIVQRVSVLSVHN